MPNNAQPHVNPANTPKQDMQRQPQVSQRDPGIMPQRKEQPEQQTRRDQGESNVKQSTKNNADIRNEANKSAQSQQATQAQDDRGLGGQRGFENEGEGNKTAARNYDRETEKFAKSGGVEAAAKEAERALDSSERDTLREAERRGRDAKTP